MYRPIITLIIALTSPICLGADPTGLTLELTDSTTGQPVVNAVVILDSGSENQPTEAEIIQKNREFQPHTLVIARHSKVDFPNRDNTQHHVYSFSRARVFDLELYAGRPEAPITFDQTGVVEIGCNIHDNMQGFILVTDVNPAGYTDDQGRLDLRLPASANASAEPGLRVWHPRMTDNTRMARFTVNQPYPDSLELSVGLSPRPAGNDRLDGLQKRFREL